MKDKVLSGEVPTGGQHRRKYLELFEDEINAAQFQDLHVLSSNSRLQIVYLI